MQIQASNDFATTPAQAFAMLTDPVFLAAVCLATNSLEHQVSVDGLTTWSRRVLAAPAAVAKFTGPKLAVIDRITWESGADQEFQGVASIEVEGLPAKLDGSVRLVAGGRGAVLSYTGELSVQVPIIGAGLAKQAAPLLLDALQIQQQVGDEYLSRANSPS
jgi:hypothetical protein